MSVEMGFNIGFGSWEVSAWGVLLEITSESARRYSLSRVYALTITREISQVQSGRGHFSHVASLFDVMLKRSTIVLGGNDRAEQESRYGTE
jgi:hypothetical protein